MSELIVNFGIAQTGWDALDDESKSHWEDMVEFIADEAITSAIKWADPLFDQKLCS